MGPISVRVGPCRCVEIPKRSLGQNVPWQFSAAQTGRARQRAPSRCHISIDWTGTTVLRPHSPSKKFQSVLPCARYAVALGLIHHFPPVWEGHTKGLQSLKYCICRLLPLLHFHLHCPTGNVDPLPPYQRIVPCALRHLAKLKKYSVPIARR